MERQFEAGMWAAWILQNDLKLSSIPMVHQKIPFLGKTNQPSPEDVVLRVTDFSGLFNLALEYDKRGYHFTQAGVDSFNKWAKQQLDVGDKRAHTGTPRTLTPIEAYF